MGQNKSKLENDEDLDSWAKQLEMDKSVLRDKYKTLYKVKVKNGVTQTDFENTFRECFPK